MADDYLNDIHHGVDLNLDGRSIALQSRIYLALDEIEKAVDAGKRSLYLDPYNASGLRNTADALVKAGELSSAALLYEYLLSRPGIFDREDYLKLCREFQSVAESALNATDRTRFCHACASAAIRAGALNVASQCLEDAEGTAHTAFLHGPDCGT